MKENDDQHQKHKTHSKHAKSVPAITSIEPEPLSDSSRPKRSTKAPSKLKNHVLDCPQKKQSHNDNDDLPVSSNYNKDLIRPKKVSLHNHSETESSNTNVVLDAYVDKVPKHSNSELCFCLKPWTEAEGDSMTFCEKCKSWIHYACAGVEKSKVDEVKRFICLQCAMVLFDEWKKSTRKKTKKRRQNRTTT